MNLQQLKYILAVAELRHFQDAAEKCNISQSTLSTMIGKFESEIDIKIFDRKTKPVTITTEGEELIQKCKIILKEVDSLYELTQKLKGKLMGQLSIGVIPTVAPYILPRFLQEFTQQHPNISFEVSEITTATIIDQLKRRELDIGILALPIHDDELREIPLYNEPFVLFDLNNEKKSKEVNLSEVDFSKFYLIKEGHCLRNQAKSICDINDANQDHKNNFEFKTGSIDSLIRFVRSNNGVTILPYLAAIDLPDHDKISIYNLTPPTPVRSIGILTHAHFVKQEILTKLQNHIMKKITPLLPQQNLENILPPLI